MPVLSLSCSMSHPLPHGWLSRGGSQREDEWDSGQRSFDLAELLFLLLPWLLNALCESHSLYEACISFL